MNPRILQKWLPSFTSSTFLLFFLVPADKHTEQTKHRLLLPPSLQIGGTTPSTQLTRNRNVKELRSGPVRPFFIAQRSRKEKEDETTSAQNVGCVQRCCSGRVYKEV